MLSCCCAARQEEVLPEEAVKAVPILGAVTEVKGFVTLAHGPDGQGNRSAPALSMAEVIPPAGKDRQDLEIHESASAFPESAGECGENLILDQDEQHLVPVVQNVPAKVEQRSRMPGSRIAMPDFTSSTAGSSRSSQPIQESTDDADEFIASFAMLPGQKMGADVAHGTGELFGTVQVRRLCDEGLFAEWNRKSPHEKQIREDLFITVLNGRKVSDMSNEEFRSVIHNAKFVMMTFKKTQPPPLEHG
mmetsp:Transcript_44413/g.81052  ORF Transcript_44413/g.81052 Transcript_44413/m.81052 type:complete len:247 (+) Transcript_44413:93-833(+)